MIMNAGGIGMKATNSSYWTTSPDLNLTSNDAAMNHTILNQNAMMPCSDYMMNNLKQSTVHP